MDYKVLYRKYRPENFSNIIGQEYIVSILQNSIKNNKISHAYIFAGPRGTGKTTTAKVFAKAINCENPTLEGPCGTCESCLHFKENADIIEIDAASNNGVEEIREIINNIKLAPAYSKYKVYIIDEVHMLTTSAFNALLLTLEEPPKHVVFILATTNIEAVPITILSRTQRFDFHKISIKDILTRLNYVVESENIKIEQAALEEIAYISDGGMRDALSILDQLASNNNMVTLEEVIAHFGSISKKQIADFYETILNNDVNTFHEMITKFVSLAIDYKLLIKKMLEKIEEEALKSKSDPDYKGLRYGTLKDMAFSLAAISNYVNINIDPYLLIEISLLKYINEEVDSTNTVSTLNTPVKEKTPTKSSSPPLTPHLSDFSPLINRRLNNCFVAASKEHLANIKNLWPDFIANLGDNSLLNILLDSKICAASDKVVILTSPLDSTATLINNSLESLASHFKKSTNLSYYFVALSEEAWALKREEYIKNLKNNIKYTYQEEPEVISEPKEKVNPIEQVASDIFADIQVEIVDN